MIDDITVLAELRFYPPLSLKATQKEYSALIGGQEIDEAQKKFKKEITEAQRYRVLSMRSPDVALRMYIQDNPKMKQNQFEEFLP